MSKIQKIDLTRYYSGSFACLVWQKNGRVRLAVSRKKRRKIAKPK